MGEYEGGRQIIPIRSMEKVKKWLKKGRLIP